MSAGKEAPVTRRASGQNSELELKFELPLGHARKARRHPALAGAPSDTFDQLSLYFDTPRLRLHRDGFSLRVRESGGRLVQTVKAGGKSAGLFDRSEWEMPVASLEPDLAALGQTPLGAMKRRLGSLEEVSRSLVRRTVWQLDGGGARIEVALDEATVCAGADSNRFGEIELELKAGPVERLFVLARELSEKLPLRIGVSSKSERGYDLAAGSWGRLRKAGAVELDEQMRVAEAFSAITHACISHFRLNEDLVVGKRDPAALHQARVAMRRLRAGLSLFGPAIRDGGFPRLREEIRWLTGSLGDARNLDVFLKRHGDQLSGRDRRTVDSARSNAYRTAVRAIESQRMRDLMLDLVEWLETGEWRGGRKAALPIRTFAERRLDRQWGRVHTDGARLRSLDEERLHLLRIDVKKMRYAVEFLGSLYRRQQVKSFAESLESIQEALGELNDEVTGRELAEVLGVQLPADGWGAGTGTRKKQLATVVRQFARLERAGPFWAPAPA